MNIDVHWHYTPEEYAHGMRLRGGAETFIEYENDDWVVSAPGVHTVVPPLYRPEAQIAEMNRRKIDVAAVSTTAGMSHYAEPAAQALGTHRMLTDSIADLVATYPDRYVGLGSVPMQDGALAAKELERAMQVKGMKGVLISTNIAGRNLDDEEFRPFFRAASELGAFVFVHPANVLAPERLSRYYLQNLFGNPSENALAIVSLIFGGVYDECPGLVCCFAHGGGTFSSLVGRWRHGYAVRAEPKAYGAHSPEQYLPRVYVDSLCHDDRICRHIIDTVGADHMMLGSDMPYDMGSRDPVDRIERLAGLSDADKALIKGETARRLLHMTG